MGELKLASGLGVPCCSTGEARDGDANGLRGTDAVKNAVLDCIAPRVRMAVFYFTFLRFPLCILGFALAVVAVCYSAMVGYPVVWLLCPSCRPGLCLGLSISSGADGAVCIGFSARTFAGSLLYVPAG